MNKQELIEKYKRLEGVWSAPGAETARQIFLQDLDQLDEPEKVKIPQFVADYIDISKFYVRTLHYALENSPEKVNLWLCENEINRQNTFARAWLDGYEVEKEKRYTVTVKGDIKEKLLVYGKTVKRYFFTKDYDLYNVIYSHTRKQLEEAGFGWVFDCEGIEVEEVEE